MMTFDATERPIDHRADRPSTRRLCEHRYTRSVSRRAYSILLIPIPERRWYHQYAWGRVFAKTPQKICQKCGAAVPSRDWRFYEKPGEARRGDDRHAGGRQ